MKQRIITIAYRLPNFRFKSSVILNILEEAGYNIDDLSQDIYRCYRNLNNKRVYQQCFLEDIYYLNDLACTDIEKELIDAEFELLFSELDGFNENIRFDTRLNVRLIRIDLESPDTAYFHFTEI